jgi:hypothetical protein
MSCIAYESIWVGEDRQEEENEENQRRDQGPRSPAYDETKHSNKLENDRGGSAST